MKYFVKYNINNWNFLSNSEIAFSNYCKVASNYIHTLREIDLYLHGNPFLLDIKTLTAFYCRLSSASVKGQLILKGPSF